MNNKQIDEIVKGSVSTALERNPTYRNKKRQLLESARKVKTLAKDTGKKIISEAIHVIPKAFLLKTERLSTRTKQAHETLYKNYIDSLNKTSIELDSANTQSANTNHSAFRSLKIDEQYNLNAIKLHELYFGNISDLNSEISFDSVPYIKLSRDFGNFERWQFDFIACCMSAREGWAVTVFDTFNGKYMNVVIDEHTKGVPLGSIPIIVMDVWAHSYYGDYFNDKKSYVLAQMKELNWDVIEARMVVAERSQLQDLWKIVPLVNNRPEVMLSAAEGADQTPVNPTPEKAEEPTGSQSSIPKTY